MSKNLKLSFILYAVFAALLIAWRTLFNFFNGMGITFVAMLFIVAVMLIILLTDKAVFNRTTDLFILTCALTVFEFILYFAFEFNVGTFNSIIGFLIVQNIISCIAILLLAYITFRFILEFKGKKVKFIEFLLGNEKMSKKDKKAKELSNGALEDKPINKENNETDIVVESNDEENNNIVEHDEL